MSFNKTLVIIFSFLLFNFLTLAKPEIQSSKSDQSINLKVEELSPKVFLIKSYRKILNIYESNKPQILDSNALLYIDGKDAYLIDTPWNAADMPSLMNWIEERGLQLKDSVVTHSHEDRSAGLGYLSQHGFNTYSSELTNKLLERDEMPVATTTFKGNTFELLKDKIEVYYPGPGHTIDNLVVWLPEEQILFGACIMRANEAKGLGWIGEADTVNWHQSVLNVQKKYPNVKLIVPGHGEIGFNQSIIIHTLKLTK